MYVGLMVVLMHVFNTEIQNKEQYEFINSDLEKCYDIKSETSWESYTSS